MKTIIHLLITGLTVMLCLSLTVLMMGCQGPEGVQGVQGQTGKSITGPQGPQTPIPTVPTPGLVTVVPLCPDSPSYPGVFVEDALCIDNALYAVYSSNGGFLTQLLPGTYTSNAIGSACNLTVLPDCVVVH